MSRNGQRIGSTSKIRHSVTTGCGSLFDEGDTTVEAFNALTDSQFPYQRIEANTFFDLIGSAPPRVYWIKDGTINQFWDNDITAGIKATFVP